MTWRRELTGGGRRGVTFVALAVRLGLKPDRSMEVPDFGLAGW